jgi:Zn-finger nucleic acid-binding protein
MCPACNEPLIVFELDGVEIDRCLKCGGTWLDDGELDHLARSGGARSDPLEAAISGADTGRSGDRRCVRCSSKMRLLTVQTVDIDRCPRGHGTWFDRSELEAILAAHKDGGLAKFLGAFTQPNKGG